MANISLGTVQEIGAPQTNLVGGIYKKVSGNTTYIYWDPLNPKAGKYTQALTKAQLLWDGAGPSYFKGLITYIPFDGTTEAVGYKIATAPDLKTIYDAAAARFNTPFKFYTDIEITTSKAYFEEIWNSFYRNLLLQMKANNTYPALMDLNNLEILDGVLYYAWYFDVEDFSNEARIPAKHPQLEEIVRRSIISPSYIDTILGLLP